MFVNRFHPVRASDRHDIKVCALDTVIGYANHSVAAGHFLPSRSIKWYANWKWIV